MPAITLPPPSVEDAKAALALYASHVKAGWAPYAAAREALESYYLKLQRRLDTLTAQQQESAAQGGPFAADNLPEVARAYFDDRREFNNKADTLYYGLNNHAARVLNRLDAAHGGRLSKLLNSTAAIETASPTPLPEWAKATLDDLLLMRGKTFSNEADPLNYHAARVLARMPVQTLSGDDVERAAKAIYERAMSFDRNGVPAWQERGNSDAQERARDVARAILARESHCQKPSDPVRFALEKVSDKEFQAMLALACSMRWVDEDGRELFGHQCVQILRAELARILPVAEPVKRWADLTDEELMAMLDKANEAYCSNAEAADGAYVFNSERYEASRKLAVASLRASLSTYAPPPRKVEVTPEVAEAFRKVWGPTSALESLDPGFHGARQDHLAGLRASFAVANTQAEARESEEIARMKGEVEQLEAQLDHVNAALEIAVKERDEAQKMAGEWLAKYEQARDSGVSLRQHADKLEAMLTVPGVGGEKVKLWLPFQIKSGEWHDAVFVLALTFGSRDNVYVPVGFNAAVCMAPSDFRQSPAPAAEPLKRWLVRPKSAVLIGAGIKQITTGPVTRKYAQLLGEVIGEAGE